MRKFGFGHRALALLLVVIMTVQLLPLGALALPFGTLQSYNPGVDITDANGNSALGLDDAINWPIKIYDYLNDGMLFEWFDTNYGKTVADGHKTVTNTSYNQYGTLVATTSETAVPYAGGDSAPITQWGNDFTYDNRQNAYQTVKGTTYSLTYTAWSTSAYVYDAFGTGTSASRYQCYSPKYYADNYTYENGYILSKVEPVDYVSPMYAELVNNPNSKAGHNFNVAYFPYDVSTGSTIRYMVVVYRASGVEDNYFSISSSSSTGGGFCRREGNNVKMPDSATWTYKVYDLYALYNNTADTDVQYMWLTWHDKNNAYGMDSGAYVHLSHVGFFDNETAAKNYGADCVSFDNNPGEYLRRGKSTTYTDTLVTLPKRSDYLNNLFSLSYHWYAQGEEPKLYPDATSAEYPHVRYGMDFTTHSIDAGWKTNAYTSDTFWTWSNGTNLSLKNTFNGFTKAESFAMTPIGVEQMTQSNGAQFVRLTTTGPSKILLSKFREDQQAWTEARVPTTSDVNYMVLVYRPNNLTSDYKYGLWAQGYLNSSSSDGNMTADFWKYAALTRNTNWTEDETINQLSFPNTSGWQYVVVPLKETIGAKDPAMAQFDRLANLGLYLPALTDGRSLDIAYVAYFRAESTGVADELETAKTFGENAVEYMNSEPDVDPGNYGKKEYTADRYWYGGGNKGFGFHFSAGGGQFWPEANSQYGSGTTCTDPHNYGYNYDVWSLSYYTYTPDGFAPNSFRKDLVWNESAQRYDKVASSTTSSTNKTYFIWPGQGSDDGNGESGYDTVNVAYDGYQLLENIASGIAITGLLEGSLQTITVDGVTYRVPVYRQEVVEYIAYNLLHALRVPMKNSSGYYNTQFIKGAASTQYGGVDLNGDGNIGWINYDGDSRSGHYENGQWVAETELNEASVDLATALRHELGMSFRLGNSVAALNVNGQWDTSYTAYSALMGNYDETVAKSRMLYGEFSNARNAIDTAMDAAYYLLNNLFIANSYNQAQDDYDYLTLSSATVNGGDYDDKKAYVFDAGFTSGTTAAVGSTFTDGTGNKNAVAYAPYTADGKGAGMISMKDVTGKTRFNYSIVNGSSWTTRFPFNPVTDAEGDYAGQTKSYYFLDDAQRVYTEGSNTYKDRNYNYVIASNGEFVYREEDGLFFQFEGDDDVYLFINGELVLDIGGAHSITSVDININDYVTAAGAALKPLEAYGYYKDMSIDEFDSWISGSTIAKLDADGNPTGETVDNPYKNDAAQIAAFKRWHRLNLSDGQICQFDFYYMERHGWGANMRILTNMHITDPDLSVEKKAYQFDQEIEYGGVIDPTSSVEYNFKLTNTGNTKLYNLNWKDDVLGITMDPENGLVVDEEKNGIYVLDSGGGSLQPKDLTALVEGEDADGNFITATVTFKEETDPQTGELDGGQAAFKRFLHKLESDNTAEGFDDMEVTKAGSGLWVGASVTFQGICYILEPEQIEAATVHNTVYLTATTRSDITSSGNRTLRSDADHRLYTNGFPVHYQWAGHNIYMDLNHLLEQAAIEAGRPNSQLSQYQEFFVAAHAAGVNKIHSNLCDKFGRVGGNFPYQTPYKDANGNVTGYYIHYDEPGVYVFYLLMYMREGKDKDGNSKKFAATGVNASDIGGGYYAVLRSQVFVADVKDSVYVLDYGLSTESLDLEGELFKNDYLFGPNSTVAAKLMGVTGTKPSFMEPGPGKTTGIDFTFDADAFAADNKIETDDGVFKVNLDIPADGKNIGYNAITGEYTLTGVGTVPLQVQVPANSSAWERPNLYYWYDDGTTGPSWPGTPMTKVNSTGLFEINIPADVTNVIVNNGSGALQTADLKITAGLKIKITLTTQTDGEGKTTVKADVDAGKFMLHAKVPEKWEKVYLHYVTDQQEGSAWPGVELDPEAVVDGYYTFELPGDTAYVNLNDGSTTDGEKTVFLQTEDIDILAGKEVWIDVNETLKGETTSGSTTYKKYGHILRYTAADENYTVHVSVPSSWKDTVNLYYWRSGSNDAAVVWPGESMGAKGEFGWYTLEVPSDVTSLVINDGENSHQTVNLTVTPGMETWIMVRNVTNSEGKYTADVAYGSEADATGLTFTPNKFMDSAENNLWMALTVHAATAYPSALNSGIDIHNEVQMYKKITVLPATVVYYEDDFQGITYNKGGKNEFVYYGDGSGLLSQDIDQSQPYGQDGTYQDASNSIYSGDHMTAVKINTTDAIATFTFTGTGFELIGRTDAVISGTTVARVYGAADYETNGANAALVAERAVVTQFDQGNDGGSESVDQIPVIRITDLTHGTYTVELSGIPSYTYCRTPISTTVTDPGDCLHGATNHRVCTNNCGAEWTTHTPAAGHSYSKVVTAPTCTTDGFTLHTCTGCGNYYVSDAVDALGHSYADGVCERCGKPEESAKTLYFKPFEDWKNGARVAAFFYNDDGNVWVDLTDLGNGYFSCNVPDGYGKVIFVRLNPDTAENSWDNKWNQTADLNVPVAVYNCLTLTDGVWDGDIGTWGNYTCLTSSHSYVDGACERCGASSEAATTRTLYFKPSDDWKNDNARFAVYHWGGNSAAAFVNMADCGEGYYSCVVPADITGLKFCRMNPATTENNWNYDVRWNDTADLTLPAGDAVNCFVLNDGWADNGTWGAHACKYIHSYVDVVITAPTCAQTGAEAHVCSVCGYGTIETLATTTDHNYVDGFCANCGGTECTHEYKTEVFAANCIDWGYTKYACTKCDYAYTGNEIAPKGHTYDGSTCSVCNDPRVSANHYAPIATDDSYVFIDGIRIYQPLGASNSAYADSENEAEFYELRELIVNGQIAVATLKRNELQVSSGTTTWSENLAGGDFDDGDENSYVGNYAESTDDYLIKGPNNEVYMDGTVTNSALAFYVKETAGDNHELQIAARALDYAEFFGSGTSKMNVQLQYGIITGQSYQWVPLARVTSGTEQYYSIPYTDCPYANGRYQIVIRAVNGDTDTPALISYSSVKLVNMAIEKIQGVGESTILYYVHGMLVKPTYYLTGDINNMTYGKDTDNETVEIPTFVDGELTMTFDYATQIGIRRDMGGKTILYGGQSALGNVTSATLYKDGTYLLSVPAGDVTFNLVQKDNGYLSLSYCAHTWGKDGEIIVEPNCTQEGIERLTCTKCGHTKDVPVEIDSDHHTYSGGACIRCGALEPKYYLIGSINGAEYTGSDYLFVDGKLVVTFDTESAVYLKAENGDTYLAEQDITDKSGIFATGKEYTGKMTLPAHVEITFTLAENKDGVSLTLSYTIPCAHQWGDGVATTPATCTKDGVKTYTCSECNATRTEVIPAGHNYDEVKRHCTACGEADPETTRLIYFFNSDNWSQPYIYTWGNVGGNTLKYTGEWAEAPMTPVEGDAGLYSYAVPNDAVNVIFHNNSGTQTADLTFPGNGSDMYTLSGGIWSTYGQWDYHLVGYINGADYASGNDSANIGDYKFVDGKLTLTFNQDSWVMVKASNNAYWYMTDGAPTEGTTSVTLYDTRSGINAEKLKVPGNTTATFTLVENADGTLTLSYVSTGCSHSYDDGQVTTEATCTTDGVKTYTCTLCGDTKTESIPAGHKYHEGVCVGCQDVLDYYLVGYINGADYGIQGDSNNLGQYKFVDGKLTVTFAQDSYVVIKNELGTQYWSEIYNSTSAGTFVTGAGEKMFVPGGKQITFTLTPDYTNDTVSLSYAAHEHVFTDGVCDCGVKEMDVYQFIYFKNTDNWSSVNIWAWVDGGDNFTGGNWPGVAMTNLGDGLYVWKIEKVRVENVALKVIFNNGSAKTADLPFPNDGRNLYDYSTGAWSTYVVPAAASVLLLEEETINIDAHVNAVVAAETEDTGNMAFLGNYVLNLESLKNQLESDTVYGAIDDGEVDTDIPDAKDPVIDLVGASLSFKDEIYYNIFFNVNNPDAVEIEEMGLITWTSEVDGTVHNAGYTATNAVLTSDGYKLRSQAVAAKNMGEELYFKVYLKLADGNYIYSELKHYSARTYATNMLNSEKTSDSMKALSVALMNYGAAAQSYFGYKTDDLMNAGLTAEQQALVSAYSADMLGDVVQPEVSKIGGLSATDGFGDKAPSINFGGALGINYNFTTTYAVEGDLKLYVWTEAQYNSVEQLTLDNASQVITMRSLGGNAYTGRVSGIAAKNMGDTVYVCGVYESNGVIYRTGVLPYSVAAYMESLAAGSTGNTQNLAKMAAVYGYYARVHLLGA